jgi:NAD-dependent deacetylase
MPLEDEIQRAAELIRQSRPMVAFTGAGHSTASGIPDFRSPDSGLWAQANPMLVASIWAFRLNPKVFYNWIRPLVPLLVNASPNVAHFALANLESAGYVKAVITQNIDDLHQKAGSRRVLELHGHLRKATCVRCYRQEPVDADMMQAICEGKIPHCACGGVLKPNVILFGEQLPCQVFNDATAEIHQCDLILIAGSSLEVQPAADLPFRAVHNGARAIVINYQPTELDAVADVVIHEDVTEILPRLVEVLG